MVPPKLRRVKENVLYHIRAARKTEKHASLRPHWEFNFARTGYATRIAQADLQCLTPEQRSVPIVELTRATKINVADGSNVSTKLK
jgi:hypothetical protein